MMCRFWEEILTEGVTLTHFYKFDQNKIIRNYLKGGFGTLVIFLERIIQLYMQSCTHILY